jgi:tetratricopeptide (TPR) repeat protein
MALMAKKALLVFLGLGILACPAGALAQGTSPHDATKEREALSLYEQGLQHYALAEYEQAIELFKAAYRAAPAPEFLFNIAQSYRLEGAGHCADAVAFYKSYLRADPDTPKRSSIEATLPTLTKCSENEPPPAKAQEPAVTAPAPRSEAPAANSLPITKPDSQLHPPDGGAHGPRIAPFVLGTGLVLAAAGGGVLLWTWAGYDSLRSTGCAPKCNPSSVDSLRTRAGIGYALVGVGATAAAVGAVWWIVSRKPKYEAWLGPLHRGVMFGITY